MSSDKIYRYRVSHELPKNKGMSFEDEESTIVFAENEGVAKELAYDSFAFEPVSEIEVEKL